jgi:hypothetical protein
MHRARANRKKNVARREAAARKQAVLPLEEQRERAKARAAERLERYPDPPRYGSPTNPPQPACYGPRWGL